MIIMIRFHNKLHWNVCALQWRHNGGNSVSNHQPHECLLSRLIRRRSKKTSKLRVTGLCTGNSPETGAFPAQRASNAENVSIWWRHHGAESPEVKNLYTARQLCEITLLVPPCGLKASENLCQSQYKAPDSV